MTMTQKNKTQKTSFQHKEKTCEKKHEKEQRGQ